MMGACQVAHLWDRHHHYVVTYRNKLRLVHQPGTLGWNHYGESRGSENHLLQNRIGENGFSRRIFYWEKSGGYHWPVKQQPRREDKPPFPKGKWKEEQKVYNGVVVISQNKLQIRFEDSQWGVGWVKGICRIAQSPQQKCKDTWARETARRSLEGLTHHGTGGLNGRNEITDIWF